MERPHPVSCDAAGFDAAAAQAPSTSARRARKPAREAVSAAAAAAAAVVDGILGENNEPQMDAAPAMQNTELEDEHIELHGTTEVPASAVETAPEVPAAEADARMPAEEVYHRIGLLTRTLHDALRELGYDKDLMETRDHLPDARDRLAYIARVTGEAAEKVLNAVDRARTVQEQLSQQANSLRSRWLAVAAYTAKGERATPAGRALVDETCQFFAGIGGQASDTQAILTDIMMAQDFHDLTGQVIRKVVTLATNMEEQLLKLLIETTPPEERKKIAVEKLEGPVVKAEGRDDVVTDQEGVDDLLASLGF
ncbi:MAG TPA: protein phosphatase CheZ [Burkholderiaceae bacterium]|nr:protein phosphatase CheZ [Burkholderiaceae bacterium]